MSGQLTLHDPPADPPLRHPFFSVAGFPYPQSPSAGTAEVLTDAPYSWLSASEHRLGAMASPCTCEEENVLALGALQASTPLQTVLIPRKGTCQRTRVSAGNTRLGSLFLVQRRLFMASHRSDAYSPEKDVIELLVI